MRKVLLAAWLTCCCWDGVTAQKAVITGEDPAYAGIRLEVQTSSNPFLEQSGNFLSVPCDDNGAFRVELDIDTATMVRIGAGIYDVRIYAEPGKHIHLELPAFSKPDYALQASPFFEPLTVPARVVGDPDNINHEIYRFDSLFTPLNELLVHSRRTGRALSADSLIDLLKSSFIPGRFGWFDQYCRFKKGMLILNEGQTGLEEISREYLGPEVIETHPAFMELFRAMFTDFLIYYNRTNAGRGINHHINRTHNLDSLRFILSGHPAIGSDTLADLVLLQELPSMFYLGNFHKEAILVLLDSMVADPVVPRYRVYAQEVRKKLSSLVIGFPPPHFSLAGANGTLYSPSDFKGKYFYLIFCTPDHYGCMMEYPFLNSFHQKHRAYLEVVSVMVAEDKEKVKEFMEQNKFAWKALFFNGNTRILRDYMVKAFPVAYLVGPDGNLVLSPAPLPTEGFEQQLFRIMRSRGEI